MKNNASENKTAVRDFIHECKGLRMRYLVEIALLCDKYGINAKDIANMLEVSLLDVSDSKLHVNKINPKTGKLDNPGFPEGAVYEEELE